MKVLFILNPISGNKSNDDAILRIHQLAVETPYDFKILYTTGKDDEKRILSDIKWYKPDRIIAGGGDGTLQLVARTIREMDTPFGVLPLGSANGFATAIGMPKDPAEAVRAVIGATRTVPLDLLIFNNKHLCIHLGDIGINAHMVKEYSRSEDRGMMAYARHLMSSMKESELLRYTITTPEQTYHKEGYMLAFANADKYGTGIQISEGAVDDGCFEICNVPRIALDDAIKAGLTALNVFVDKNMFSDVISCEHAEVSISQKVHFQIDGEYMGMTDKLTVGILPSSVPLLVS
ncbi:diacylglycerol kinase family protein [Chryseolinea sp. T2]|uniref:diacylglycerol/lipid kinase family protein n=1 Tax=Chryseolinea sp. T2 TaxID=3129255 RepID=UPI003076B0B7